MGGPKTSAMVNAVLIDAPRTNDQQRFEEVFRRHYAPVYQILLRLTGSPEEAEDLAQEVFLRLHQQPPRGGEEANLGGWLYRVATNLGFNALRSRRRYRHRLLRWARLEQPLQGGAMSPATEVEHNVAVENVRRVLMDLSDRDRTILLLRSSGISYREMAVALGVKPSSVGTLLARAERALRERYASIDPDINEERAGER